MNGTLWISIIGILATLTASVIGVLFTFLNLKAQNKSRAIEMEKQFEHEDRERVIMSKTAFFDPSLTTFFDPPGDY
jgi:flagellar basal body-associated protein FliL